MSKVSSNKCVSVFIPTYNGKKYVRECIDSILTQHLPEGYRLELLVTDSGSTDGTLDILQSYGDRLLLNQIPNSEFSHGGTRQKAAQEASGEFVLYLSQDATPANKHWIVSMLEPFFVSPQIGCVFGKQIPRPDAAATIKREVAGVFGGLGAPDSIILHRQKSLIDGDVTNELNTFFSDVNSAVRRELLISKIPFRNVSYAEDQALAEDMQKAGYLKAYAPLGAVWHSNEYTVREYYKRKFDEYIGLQESVGTSLGSNLRSLLLGWIRPTLADYKFIRRDSEYGTKSKVLWYAKSPFYNMALQLGKYRAIKHFDNPEKRQKMSLEAKLRK